MRTQSTQKYSYLGRSGIGGGLNVADNAILVDENQMVIADNVLVGTTLARKKRGGQELFHTSSYASTASYPASGVPIRGVIEYWRYASATGIPESDIFLHQDDKIWSIDNRNTIAENRTGSLTLDTNGVPDYQVFDGILYFTSTETGDGYNKWNGLDSNPGDAEAATAPSDGPGAYITAHQGRMWMAGNPDFPFRLYYSESLNPEGWAGEGVSAGGSLDIEYDGDPEGITSIFPFQGRLYVWTRRSLFEVTGTDATNFSVRVVSRGIGCVSNASVVAVPNDVIFISERGVHSLRQVNSGLQTETTFISRSIQPIFTELINASLRKRIIAMYDEPNNLYVVSIPSSGQGENDQILTYNIEFGIWTLWPDIAARSLAPVLISNKTRVLLGREDGKLSFINNESGTDLGQGYTMRFVTGILYPGGDTTVERVFKSITVLASTKSKTNFSIAWSIDGQKSGSRNVALDAGEDVLGTTFVLGQSTLGTGQHLPKTVPIDEVGYGIQIEIRVGGTSNVEIFGFILETEDAGGNYA